LVKMDLRDIATRPMRVKVLYTFDQDNAINCLARLPDAIDVPVAYNDDTCPLGVIDLPVCLKAIHQCSPELIAGTNSRDYAVYSIDFTEQDQPLVGHGMLSWLLLQNKPVQLVGRITNNILPLYTPKETLEIHLRLKPMVKTSQADYVASIMLYQSLASSLPQDFNHPAWAQFVAKHELEHGSGSLIPIKRPPSDEEMTKSNIPVVVRQQQQQQQLLPGQQLPAHQLPAQQLSAQQLPAQHLPAQHRPAQQLPNQVPSKRIKCDNSSRNSFYLPSSPPPSSRPYPMNSQRQLYSDDPKLLRGFSSDSCGVPVVSSAKELLVDSNGAKVFKMNPVIRLSSIDLSKPSPSADDTPSPGKEMDNKKEIKPVSRAKLRPKERIERDLADALTNGEVPNYCENCGTVRTSTWRRTKDGSRDFLLCNPCGLWYRTKKTMRPEVLWNARKRSSVQKTDQKTTNFTPPTTSPSTSPITEMATPGDEITNAPTTRRSVPMDSVPQRTSPSERDSNGNDADGQLCEKDPEPINAQQSVNNHNEQLDESNDDSNKENQPPVDAGHIDPYIESLFATPKKHGPGESISPSSKWISKFIHSRSDDEDVFKQFLDSPSKRLVADMSFDSMDTATIASDSLTVPSSPPTSFFYLYEESTNWSKQWAASTEENESPLTVEDIPSVKSLPS
jgi:hypothetical protein